MTDDRMALLELVEQRADGDLVREMLAFAAERIMEAEVEARTGEERARRCGRSSATDTRPDCCDGSRWRSRSCARAATSRASWNRIAEKALGSLRPRRLDPIGRRPGQSHGRGRHVEEPGQPALLRIDERVNAFLSRPLEGAWPYLWLDATYLKVREDNRRWRSTRTAIEVLGVAPSEAETFWTDFLRSLADRGLRQLVIADDHKGETPHAAFSNATQQRCRVHWMRNALAHAPAKQRTAVAEDDLRSRKQGRGAGPVGHRRRCTSRRYRTSSAPSWTPPATTSSPTWTSYARALGPDRFDQPPRTREPRDQAPRRCHRHLPQR